MSDYTLEPALTLVVGATGTGKTTWALRYLLNRPDVAVRFIFDWDGQVAARLGLPRCGTETQCRAALADRWVCFHPDTKFPGDHKAGFRWFCWWAYHISRGGPGKKLFMVDEVWQFQDNWTIPKELALICQTGRAENIELVAVTQMPHRINSSVTGQTTELICFLLDEPKALEAVQSLRADAATVQSLLPGQWVSYNRRSRGPGSIVTGRVF